MTIVQQQAVDQVLALRRLTRETGMSTTRTVNNVLRALSDADLVVVAQALSDATPNPVPFHPLVKK